MNLFCDFWRLLLRSNLGWNRIWCVKFIDNMPRSWIITFSRSFPKRINKLFTSFMQHSKFCKHVFQHHMKSFFELWLWLFHRLGFLNDCRNLSSEAIFCQYVKVGFYNFFPPNFSKNIEKLDHSQLWVYSLFRGFVMWDKLALLQILNANWFVPIGKYQKVILQKNFKIEAQWHCDIFRRQCGDCFIGNKRLWFANDKNI